ncbi:MAG TPA: LuxR C-terminal-related transcriptional regulator [Actinomycetota bacterium]|jgi:LuxR family maltose regulon positive regulatory protein|nr:LuxR C-terminal-related transcriptional regulator [Actinomycetota bacterium]
MLASKLTPPRSAFRQVTRPRLFDLLDAGTQELLTLVSGPAGAGKTTLLASWSASRQPPGPVAWLSLDAGDNDAAAFWTYVVAALCRSGAVPDDSQLRALDPPPGPDQAFLSHLVGGLAELPTPVVLVLHDLHDITDPTVLEGLEFLLRHGPAQLRLVLATRVDPPLPLQRLRVGGRLTQIRAADLTFTVAEVGELLAEIELQQPLSQDDLAALQARTEGWAAGLRLAALSLEGQADPHQFVTRLAGEDRTIADYLTGEVLERQPAELRDFLLRTCVVDELSGDLADALTGGDDGESMLARLERANAFVSAVDSRRRSYRYHQLFAELLRYELGRESPGLAARLHRRAAGWYAERGLGESAIQQALLAKDWRYAADLIARHAPSRILRGGAAAVHDQVGRLPDELVQADPELALLAGAEPRATEPADEERRDRLALLRAAMDSALAWQAGDLDQVVVAGEAALALQSRVGTDSADVDAWAITLTNVGAAQLWAGRLDDAGPRLREGLVVATRAGPATVELACLSQLGLLHALRGEFDEALQWGGSALKVATEHGWSSSTQAAGGHLALAWAHYYADDLGDSSSCLDQAAAASGVGWQPMALAVAILRARLQRARGDLTGALGTVALARRGLGGWRPPTALWRWLLLTEAELRGSAGQPQSSRALLENLHQSGPPLGGEAVVLARLRLAEGDAAGAAATIAPCLEGAQPGGFLMVPAEAWLTDALSSDALADHDRAAASLERALGLAERGGQRRSFLDAGAPARSLLIRYRQRVPAFWSYADELVQASAESARMSAEAPKLIEHLTEREQTVLRYLPSLMTYEEIATDLVVSLNTVKTHAHGIFRKLGVTGRRQAVRSARELHLL